MNGVVWLFINSNRIEVVYFITKENEVADINLKRKLKKNIYLLVVNFVELLENRLWDAFVELNNVVVAFQSCCVFARNMGRFGNVHRFQNEFLLL